MTAEEIAMAILDELGRPHYPTASGEYYACQEPERFVPGMFYDPLCRGCAIAFRASVVQQMVPLDTPTKVRVGGVDCEVPLSLMSEAMEIVARHTNIGPLPMRERESI